MARTNQYWQALRKKAKAAGVCTACRKNKAREGLTRCTACWFKLAALRNLGDSNQWRELQSRIESQQYRCAYSGRQLTIGQNASVEHIEARSRSKRRAVDPDNIKWVDVQVNMAKGAQTMNEFITLCKDILNNFGYEVRKEDGR